MKRILVIVGAIALVMTVAAWSSAHGPGYGYGPGGGFYPMGPGMHGPGMHGPGMYGLAHMGYAWGPGQGPCWQPTELTPEQSKQYEEWREQSEERAKASVEQYLQRFLPNYKLEKKEKE
jgi:hypothetical protein